MSRKKVLVFSLSTNGFVSGCVVKSRLEFISSKRKILIANEVLIFFMSHFPQMDCCVIFRKKKKTHYVELVAKK